MHGNFVLAHFTFINFAFSYHWTKSGHISPCLHPFCRVQPLPASQA